MSFFTTHKVKLEDLYFLKQFYMENLFICNGFLDFSTIKNSISIRILKYKLINFFFK